MKLATQADIIVGASVLNSDGETGIVLNFDKAYHNIEVDFKESGVAIHCINHGCHEIKQINGVDFPIQLYDPLFVQN